MMPQRCLAAGVPSMIAFATKNEIARAQIEAALKAGIPRGTVLGTQPMAMTRPCEIG